MRRPVRLPGTVITGAVLSVALSAATEPQQHEGVSIDAGTAVERHVAMGEKHAYQLTLNKAECATVIVEQKGIDTVVRVSRTGDGEVVEFQEDVRRSGQEEVAIVADDAGVYRLEIEPSRGIYSGTYAIRLVTRRTATESDRSMYEARRLRTLALDLIKAARFQEARRLLEQAIALGEAHRGPDDVFVGMLIHDLNGGLLETRDFAKAETQQRRASAIFDKSWGATHPYSAMSRLRLGVLLLQAGQRVQAEAEIASATQAVEASFGTEHAWYATCLRAQASLRYNARDFDAAEETYRRAMVIHEKVGDKESPSAMAVLNNLGLIYADRQELERADEHYRRGLALADRLEGPDGYHVALHLLNLSRTARDRKDYVTAIDLATRALAIRERLVGAEHPDLAPVLANLAINYRLIGDVPRATEMFLQSLRILERNVGPYHRNTLSAVGNVAQLYWDTGQVSKAVQYQRRADAILEKQLELNLAVGSERQKLAFTTSITERTDRTISLHLRSAPDDIDAAALAALVVLQRKGRVLDAMTDAFATARRKLDDDRARELLQQLNNTTTRLAQLAVNATDEDAGEERQRAIGGLEAEKERLEVQLGAYSNELRVQMQTVTLEAVQAAIPEDAALLEFTVFRPFDHTIEADQRLGPPHYAAYVLRKNAPPRGIDLGPAATIDGAIETLRQVLRDRTSTNVKAPARAVQRLLMRPLLTSIPDVKRLLVAPDGGLNLIPFEALVDERGQYLIERFSIVYLSSGRDLLRLSVPRGQHSAPVIIADPDYGAPATALASGRAKTGLTAQSGGVTTAADNDLYFPALANTAEEARALRRLFPEAVLLTGTRANKAAVARLDAPRMLHIASHGFFLREATAGGGTQGLASSAAGNPLLRSGIALAGANAGREHRAEGILTALEASGLNLWSTQLVTLSACDTGVGEVRNGEGVYGLRRAFLLAGTETLVMSLWPLSDYTARETMVRYYTGLRDGLGRGDSLRRAKLAMLKEKVRQHPYYWASFIQSGEWASLDGRR